jgi:catechol 2,3-dioxygenase-like lactoylglutathione lyase family enzyme
MITGVEHIAIASFDPHRLGNWYVKHLNFTVILDTGKTLYLRAPNGVVLEFVFAETQPAPPLIRDAGIRHLALLVGNLDETREELQMQGIEFDEKPVVLPGMRIHFFRDPEGNFLHLVEREVPLG